MDMTNAQLIVFILAGVFLAMTFLSALSEQDRALRRSRAARARRAARDVTYRRDVATFNLYQDRRAARRSRKENRNQC